MKSWLVPTKSYSGLLESLYLTSIVLYIHQITRPLLNSFWYGLVCINLPKHQDSHISKSFFDLGNSSKTTTQRLISFSPWNAENPAFDHHSTHLPIPTTSIANVAPQNGPSKKETHLPWKRPHFPFLDISQLPRCNDDSPDIFWTFGAHLKNSALINAHLKHHFFWWSQSHDCMIHF